MSVVFSLTEDSVVGIKNECCVGPQRVQWLD